MRFKAFLTKTTANAKTSMSKVSTTVKLHSKKNSLNDELAMMFDTLGKMYYFGSVGDGVNTEDMENIIQNITSLKTQISDIEEELRALNGKKICPSCNSELQKNISYCPHCGSRVNAQQTEASDSVLTHSEEPPLPLNDN